MSIERPSRYSKQLAGHLGHKIEVSEVDKGWRFQIEGAVGLVITSGEAELTMTVTADSIELQERMQFILQKHLLKFAGDLEPVVTWN